MAEEWAKMGFSSASGHKLFTKLCECLALYFPDFDSSLELDEGRFTMEIENLKGALDAVVLCHLVEVAAGHIRDIEVTWVSEPQPSLTLTLCVSEPCLDLSQVDIFVPSSHPQVTLRESLQAAKNFDARQAPESFHQTLPFYEEALDRVYSRGLNISTPQTTIWFDENNYPWLKIANMDSVRYSFLEHLSNSTCVSVVLFDPQDQVLWIMANPEQPRFTFPARAK